MEKPWVFDRIREVQKNPNNYIDIWAREHYKSTVITFGLTIQDILASHGDDPLPEWNGREVTVGIFSFNRPSAKKFLRQIKQEFESNDNLKTLFPDILYQNPKKESPKWSEDDGLIVKRSSNPREATVEASGLVDGQPTGMHYVLRVYDDVVTLESARSIEMVRKTTDAWELSLSLGSEGGIQRYIGTRYADGDSYHDIMESGLVSKRIHPATADGTSTGMPVLFSQEYLDSKKTGSIYNFSCQYLCDPVPDDNAYFTRDDFGWYDPGELPKNLHRIGAGDYAVTEGGGDFTELGVAGLDENDDLYIIDWWFGQRTSDVWVDEILRMARKHKPFEWGAESGVIKRAVEPMIKKRMRETRTYCIMKWFPAIADKPTNCRAFQARARMGKVMLPKGAKWAERLIEQAIRFPRAKHDDIVDVLGLFGRMLEDLATPRYAPPPQAPAANDGYAWSDENSSNDWMTV